MRRDLLAMEREFLAKGRTPAPPRKVPGTSQLEAVRRQSSHFYEGIN
jgi:hypothetical protein